MSLGLVLSFFTLSGAEAEIKAPCRLEVDNAHISSNLLRKERRTAVKVIFRSICNADQNNLKMKLQIMKAGRFGDHPATSLITRNFPFVSAHSEVKIQDIYIYCKNTLRTFFYGVAEAEARINDFVVRATKVRSTKIVPLNCGT